MKEIKKIGLVARLLCQLRAWFGCPAPRRVRVYILQPDRIHTPSPKEEQHLRWQRFLVRLEQQRLQRRQQFRRAQQRC